MEMEDNNGAAEKAMLTRRAITIIRKVIPERLVVPRTQNRRNILRGGDWMGDESGGVEGEGHWINNGDAGQTIDVD